MPRPIPSLSFPQNCQLWRTPYNSSLSHPCNLTIVSHLLLDLTGLHWVLFWLSPVTCCMSGLILLFDVITIRIGHNVTNCKAPQCVILFISITSCLLFTNSHKITSSPNTKSLQFQPYGRSIGSWICLTHKTYTCHTVQNRIRYDIR
jgi:hypothetical protein